jgi:hypothetical protein
VVAWHNPISGWQRVHSERIAREERMLDERRRTEQDARECTPPDGPLAPAFFADERVITPQAMRTDSDGQFVVVLVDGRMCCLGAERGTDERTGMSIDREVLMLVEPGADNHHEDAPDCPTALQWCGFEYAVRTKDRLALAVYGLMRFAQAWRSSSDEERARQAMSEADAVFDGLAGGGQ